MNITDTNDVPISYLNFHQEESTDSPTFVIRVPCEVGMVLAATAHADARVKARRTGTADAFVDIATSPISLTPYAGSTEDFDMKVHTNAISGSVLAAVEVKATFNP